MYIYYKRGVYVSIRQLFTLIGLEWGRGDSPFIMPLVQECNVDVAESIKESVQEKISEVSEGMEIAIRAYPKDTPVYGTDLMDDDGKLVDPVVVGIVTCEYLPINLRYHGKLSHCQADPEDQFNRLLEIVALKRPIDGSVETDSDFYDVKLKRFSYFTCNYLATLPTLKVLQFVEDYTRDTEDSLLWCLLNALNKTLK